MIQIDVDGVCDEFAPAEDGDHNIREESVDVDKRVGTWPIIESPGIGLHANEVIPASCPIKSASNVIENC